MSDQEDSKYTLLEFEKRFLELYGEVFELRRSNNFGRIFALIVLKARSEERGLDQQDIVKYLNHNFKDSEDPKDIISLSTVSRILTKMEKSKYCSSTPSSGRGRRKYFSEQNFTKLVQDRIEANIREGMDLVVKLKDLKKEIPDDNSDQFTEIHALFDDLTRVYGITSQEYEDVMNRIIKKIEASDNQKKPR